MADEAKPGRPITINQGQRLPVTFGPISAQAGVVTDPATGVMEVAFFLPAKMRMSALRSVEAGTVGGQAVKVVPQVVDGKTLNVRASDYVPGMVVLVVEWVA